MKDKTNQLKSFSDSNICRNEEKGNLTSQKSEMVINCFYSRKFSPCTFTTPESHLMEKHYRQKHYAKAKEVYHG